MARHHFPRPLTGALLGFALILCGLPVWTVADPQTATYSFTILEVPGATATSATSINNSGQVTGSYVDSSGRQYGFLYNNGTLTTFEVPGATIIEPSSINASGQVAGSYYDGSLRACIKINYLIYKTM